MVVRKEIDRFSSAIIGHGSLPIRCAEILVGKAHAVDAIVSSDESVIQWADENSIRCFESVEDYRDGFSGSVDYLFSINNEHILTKEILETASKQAFNYHDSLLPSYAGTHATSWALLNGEKSHGVSWHLIVDKVDAGDIAKQGVVAISDQDTAFSLNTKCFEAAVKTFEELVEDLGCGRLDLVKQDSDGRSFFPRFKRPPNVCVISWNSSAKEIARLVRALDFGDHPNELGKAKLSVGTDFFVVNEIEVLDSRPTGCPGTIVRVDHDSLQISACDADVVIRSISTVDGLAIAIADLRQRADLREGQVLQGLEEATAGSIDELIKQTAAAERYWVDKLAAANRVAVPYARKGSLDDTVDYNVCEFELPTEFLATVDQAALGSKLLGAFGALLSRLSGQGRFSIGYKAQDLDEKNPYLSGLFATTLPLEITVDDRAPLQDLVSSVEREVFEARRRKTYLRDAAMRYPSLVSDDAISNISWPVTFSELDGIETHLASVDGDLTLALSNGRCYWIFSSSLEVKDVEVLSGQMTLLLLKSLVADEISPVGSLPLMNADQISRLFESWRGESVEYPSEQCLHRLFEQRAEQTPDAIAAVFEDEQVSYAQLDRRANQLANYLLASGLVSGEPVGIATERTIEMIVAALGVMKTGGFYIPIDPLGPSERLNYVVGDADLSVVLSQEKYAEDLRRSFPHVICFDTDSASIAAFEDSRPTAETSSEKPAYAIYTSGSTGKPKGVLISHRSLVNHAVAISRRYELSLSDRVLQFANFSFDVAAEEIFPTLLSGAAVVILPPATQSSLARFSEFLTEQCVSVVNLPVSYWREWTAFMSGKDYGMPSTVRLIVTGSERVYAEDYNSWRRIAGPNVRWLNAYGLTETTITSMVFEPPDREEELGLVPIGKPIDNTHVYVLDKNLQPVPLGVPGELYIGGDCVGIGYLNRPELTAERFVSNHLNETAASVLYRTGDRVRTLPDGNIEFLDRVDNQVKIRGFRVELGEIEKVIGSHADIEEAVVVPSNTESTEAQIVGYFVPKRRAFPEVPIDVEVWPSMGEYPVYDDLMYYAMSADTLRTSRYKSAIEMLVYDKVVVEIGTGRDIILARMCVAAGAKHVYAIEVMEESFNEAQNLIDSLGLADKITLLHGFSSQIEIPEKADVCLSEIIGTIGSSEGAIPVLNDARRFLKPDGVMIPERCVTKLAAVQLPDDLVISPKFSALSSRYASKVFENVGCSFDLRVSLKPRNIAKHLSADYLFEDLDFSKKLDAETCHDLTISIERNGRIDGFLLWLNLFTAKDLQIDSLNEESSWLPVFFPAFDPGVNVSSGDELHVTVSRSTSSNGINPDYSIDGVLRKAAGDSVHFHYDSLHHEPSKERSGFYKRLFERRVSPAVHNGVPTVAEIREFLSERLPAGMIPSRFVQLDRMPTTRSGKIDRVALAARSSSSKKTISAHGSPKDDTEGTLAEIWKDVLEIEHVGTRDNFFDLGGHSLKAIRMFAEVEAKFRKNIPLGTLFTAGTIEELAEIIRQDVWHEPETSIVPIQPDGTKPPLFCIHAGGGNVLFYRDLAKHLGTDQPLFGIQARRVGGRQVAHETVEEMATFYISELRSVQPKGPFYLGGSSFGGVVALEMAQQLRDQGDDVALLALMDTGAPTYPQLLAGTTPFKAKIYESARRIQHHFDSLLGLASEHRLPYILQKLAKLKLRYGRKKRHLFRRAAQSYNARFNADKELSAEYIQLEDQIEKSLERYKVRSFSGKITLFRALNQPLGIVPDPTLGWDGIPSELEIHDVPGHHGSVVAEPYVGVLAEKLAVCIDRAAGKQNLNGNGPTDQERNGATAVLPKSATVAASNGRHGGAFGLFLFFTCPLEIVCVELLAFSASLGLPII